MYHECASGVASLEQLAGKDTGATVWLPLCAPDQPDWCVEVLAEPCCCLITLISSGTSPLPHSHSPAQTTTAAK